MNSGVSDLDAQRSNRAAGSAPRDASIWMWLQGFGIGIIVMLRLLWPHISPLHEDLFHRNLPMTPVYRGVLIDFAVVCAAGIALVHWMDRRDPHCRSPWWIVIAAILASREVSWSHEALVVFAALTPRTTFLVCLSCGTLLWFFRRSWYGKAVRFFRLGLMAVGCCICWILPQLSWTAVHPEPVQASSFVKALGAAAPHRIVWILFDELSRDQTFDHRYPGLALPAFDRFAQESVSFSNVQPDGYMTEFVIPGLMDGQVITGEKTDLDGRFYVKSESAPKWHLYAADRTLLADAQQAGWSTGLSGWFLPYCRLYSGQLNDCFRTMRDPVPGGYSRRQSVLWNALAPIRTPLLQMTGQVRKTSLTQEHAQDFEDILGHGMAMIADERIGFVLVHLPVPHPPGFYNRGTDMLGRPGSYVDNLALADKTLGELLQHIAKTAAADRTTVLISSDHSWRIPMWSPAAGWTREDEAALGNRGFDQRPVLMVRLPDERTGTLMTAPFPIIREHELIEMILKHRITTSEQLRDWAATN